MTRLTDLTVAGALDGLAKGSFSAKELTQAHLEAMAAARHLNAYITETPEKALTMAEGAQPGAAFRRPAP